MANSILARVQHLPTLKENAVEEKDIITCSIYYGATLGLFSLFSPFQQLTVNMLIIKGLSSTGFEPWLSGIENNRSAD